VTNARTVLVPAGRVVRWFDNFRSRHGDYALTVDGALCATASDGAVARAVPPFERAYAGSADLGDFLAEATRPTTWGLLLVRKGGFAVALVDSSTVAASKIGRRHVQGRTKAGGQSQQRFARRRENQAQQAYGAAADHAHRLLVVGAGPLEALVCGGDRRAVAEVLDDPRLGKLAKLRVGPWLDVADPRRAEVDRAVLDGSAVVVTVQDPD
jgi:hypothetical protein